MYIDKIKCLDTLEKFKFSINFMLEGSVKYVFILLDVCVLTIPGSVVSDDSDHAYW